MQVKVIKHRTEYEVAMKRLHELLDIDPKEGTDLADELEVDFRNKPVLIASSIRRVE